MTSPLAFPRRAFLGALAGVLVPGRGSSSGLVELSERPRVRVYSFGAHVPLVVDDYVFYQGVFPAGLLGVRGWNVCATLGQPDRSAGGDSRRLTKPCAGP